jgi:hypothetical protein
MSDQQKLEVIHDLFQHEGWGLMTQLIQEARKNLSDIRSIDSIEKLQYNRGRLHQLDELENFPVMVRQQLDALESEDVV